MKILVTGASGFLGSFVTKALVDQGHELDIIRSKDHDLTSDTSLEDFAGKKYDKIYHLAVWTQAGDFCLRHPGEQWMINQKINTNALSFWQKHQPQAKFITIGTSCAFASDVALTEDNYLKGEPIESLYAYGMTKRMMLVGLQALHKQYGLEYLYVIPSTLYGANYYKTGKQMHFIFDLIRKILSGKHFGTEVVLWGDGHQKRELVHVEDFVSALLSLDTVASNEVFNIGMGREYSIREFANEICSIVDYDPSNIKYDETRYVGAKSKVLITDKIENALPEWKRRSLHDGLKDAITWFEQNALQNPANV